MSCLKPFIFVPRTEEGKQSAQNPLPRPPNGLCPLNGHLLPSAAPNMGSLPNLLEVENRIGEKRYGKRLGMRP